jgi:magnesium transporter
MSQLYDSHRAPDRKARCAGDLIGARPPALDELASAIHSHVVSPTTDREDAASLAIHTGVSVLGVCYAETRFIGAVPASALSRVRR